MTRKTELFVEGRTRMTLATSRTNTDAVTGRKPVASRLPSRADMRRYGLAIARSVLPPLVVLIILLGIWQIAFGRPGATLPSPLQVWSDA